MDNIGKNIDAFADLHKAAKELNGLNNYLRNAFVDLYNRVSDDFDKGFEECWKNIKKEYGDKVKKVKESFVKNVALLTQFAIVHIYETEGIIINAPLSEIVH